MRNLLKSLTDCLWPVGPKTPARALGPDVYLRPLIVLVILLLCGPEVFAVANLVSLVDLFGAVLFLTAFAVGYRALGLAAFAWLQRMLFPAEWTVLVKIGGRPSIVAHGLVLIGMNALRVSLVCLIAFFGVLKVVSEVA